MIGCASGQVVLGRSHPEYLGGTKFTNNVGELQAMCCAVLWLIEQNRIDDSMRLEIRFDSKYAAAAAVGTHCRVLPPPSGNGANPGGVFLRIQRKSTKEDYDRTLRPVVYRSLAKTSDE